MAQPLRGQLDEAAVTAEHTLASYLQELRAERDVLQAERDRLADALRKIDTLDRGGAFSRIARAALAGTEQP